MAVRKGISTGTTSFKARRITTKQRHDRILNIAIARKRKKMVNPFKKRKGWRSGQGATKKSYNRWIPK